MRVIVENSNDRFIGLSLVFSPEDVDRVIADLNALKAKPDQHFHLCTNGNDGPFVDIEISVNSAGSTNAWKSGFAIEPKPT
ncbi:hypothetical protein [Lacipirellula limnantheis]|uniref:Uncharacterized protein n=1 Tax=Lacipirellula limnantheis TaxID=2528024 RepID=A0A517U5U0_9BACT|nr:hypothetical protein [Lacipirellula limnantheis]QDT75999.1 hypothetical protein I41_52440 [Lacipirellula limnantheis]